MKHLEAVKNIINGTESYLDKCTLERLLGEMKERESIFSSHMLTKLTKLKRITSKRTYDIDRSEEELSEANRIALRHTVHLINKLLKFEEMSKKEETIEYTREVNGFVASMIIEKEGFRLHIHNNVGEAVLERKVGAGRYIVKYSWVGISKEVKEAVDYGILYQNPSVASSIWEVNYRVDRDEIETIKAKIREALVEVGLMDRVYNSTGFTVGTDKWNKDVITVRDMYYGMFASEFKECVRVITAVLNSEGYTKVYRPWEE